MKQTKYDRERLLFRRQFILGPRFVEGFQTWNRLSVRPSICLTTHPDLPAHQARSGDISLLLLGYILDPYRPQATDADIINRLLAYLEAGGTLESLIRLTSPFGGRWILVVDNGQAVSLFNDPTGYRQVFYSCTGSHGLWCASQPGLLAQVLNLPVDEEALAFIRNYQKREPQYYWPGDSSLYKEVRHLLPNHFLDLETGACHRYWPTHDLTMRPLEQVVKENTELLQGLIESASHRFELALSITAGRDTRLLLAASKAVRDRLYCFTMMYWDLNSDSPDIQIPSRLLSRLGLPHHVIRCPSRMEPDFDEIYRQNVTTARAIYGTIAQGLYNQYPSDRTCMKGNAMEIAKSQYRADLQNRQPGADKGRIDPQTLAWLTRREDEFAIEAFDRWLSRVNQTNVDVLDLFRWEDREGNWQAMSQCEWDIVYEVFVPYDCRLFLANMLSVPARFRAAPSYALQEQMILHLWPDLLSEAVNPPVTRNAMSGARKLLRRIGRK